MIVALYIMYFSFFLRQHLYFKYSEGLSIEFTKKIILCFTNINICKYIYFKILSIFFKHHIERT